MPLRSSTGRSSHEVVRAVAGRPDDRLDLAVARSMPSGGASSTFVGSAIGAAARPCHRARSRVAHSSMVSSSRAILRSASAHMFRSEPENCALPSADAGETADELHADVGQGIEVERRPVGRAGELQRGHTARPRDVVDLRHSARRARRPHPSTTGYPCRGRCAARGCARRPTDTGRPERWISSAIWMPVAEAPTTSTPPSASWSGLR